MDKKARPCVNVGPLINLINVCDMTLEHDHIIRCNFLLDRTFCYVNILVSDLIGVSTATKTFGPTIARLVVDRHCGPRWQSPYCGGTVPLLTGTDRLEDPHGVLLASLFGWVEWEGGTRSGVLSPSKRIEWVAHSLTGQSRWSNGQDSRLPIVRSRFDSGAGYCGALAQW
jgi:hypothetical protein